MKSSRIIITFLFIIMLVTATAALGFEAPKVIQPNPINPQSAIFIGNSYTAELDPAVAKHLQTVAWDTVKEFYRMD